VLFAGCCWACGASVGFFCIDWSRVQPQIVIRATSRRHAALVQISERAPARRVARRQRLPKAAAPIFPVPMIPIFI
jgi:hypothetical protein